MDVEQSAGMFSAAEATQVGKKKQSDPSFDEDRSVGHGENDLLGGEKVDAVLAAKMVQVNDVSLCGRADDLLCRGDWALQTDSCNLLSPSRPSMRLDSLLITGNCSASMALVTLSTP